MPEFTRGDVVLHYELDGEGVPLVLISGFTGHSNDAIATTIRPLVAERYQVLAVDNRGAGQTVVPPGTGTTIDDMANDIAAIMDSHQLTDAHVFGISMGGCIAMTLALRHPDKVRSLMAAVSFARRMTVPDRSLFMLQTSRDMRDQGAIPRTLINRYTAVFLVSEDVFQNEVFMDAWVNAPVDPYEQTRAGYELQVGALAVYDIHDRINSITVPTLVVSSPDDILVMPRYQDEIASLIPNAEIKRYPGGHLFMIIPTHNTQFFEDAFEFWAKHSE